MTQENKYPKLKRASGYLKRKTCQLCGARTGLNFIIEWNYMRGDDSVYKVCKFCQTKIKKPSELIKAIEEAKAL